ncbi:MAG: Gfo/Idh/MocA family protein [Acidimicrobiales bacterium]
MSERVGLAVVGPGWWGRVLADAIGRTSSAEVVSCFARTVKTRAEFAADYNCSAAASLEELLADEAVQGVVYATPHTLHRSNIEQAAAAGVHTFVEKPFTLTADDGRAAAAAAEAGGIQLMVGHQRRRQTANRAIRAMIDDGTIGTPVQAEATFNVAMGYPDSWRVDPSETPLGGMTALGVHHLDTFHYLLGEVARVSAFSNPVLSDQPLDHATGVLLEFRSGAVATLLTTHFAPMANRVTVWGSAGAGFNENDGGRLFTQDRNDPTRSEESIEPNDALAEQMAEFAAAIRGKATIETGGDEGVAVIEVFEAALASARRGQVVDVDEFRAG